MIKLFWNTHNQNKTITDNKNIVDAKQTSYVITGESVVNTNEFKALRL